MPGPAPSVVFALEQVRNAAGEFDHLQAALHVALGVGESLAVLGGEKPRQLIEFLLRQIEEFHHDAGTPLRIGGGPAGLRRFRHRDGVLDFGAFGERDCGLHLAGVWIENVAASPRSPLHLFAADEVADLAHELSPGRNKAFGAPVALKAYCAAFFRSGHGVHAVRPRRAVQAENPQVTLP